MTFLPRLVCVLDDSNYQQFDGDLTNPMTYDTIGSVHLKPVLIDGTVPRPPYSDRLDLSNMMLLSMKINYVCQSKDWHCNIIKLFVSGTLRAYPERHAFGVWTGHLRCSCRLSAFCLTFINLLPSENSLTPVSEIFRRIFARLSLLVCWPIFKQIICLIRSLL